MKHSRTLEIEARSHDLGAPIKSSNAPNNKRTISPNTAKSSTLLMGGTSSDSPVAPILLSPPAKQQSSALSKPIEAEEMDDGPGLKKAIESFTPKSPTDMDDSTAFSFSEEDISSALATFGPCDPMNLGTSSLQTATYDPNNIEPIEPSPMPIKKVSLHPDLLADCTPLPIPTDDDASPLDETDPIHLMDASLTPNWMRKLIIRSRIVLTMSLVYLGKILRKGAATFSSLLRRMGIEPLRYDRKERMKRVVARFFYLGTRPFQHADNLRKLRRQYRLIAAIIGVVSVSACFALISLFLVTEKGHEDKTGKTMESSKVATLLTANMAKPRFRELPPVDKIPEGVFSSSSEVVGPYEDEFEKENEDGETVKKRSRTSRRGVTKDKKRTVHIRLVGLPDKARVRLNGERVSRPLVVKRSKKAIKIEASAPGYTRAVKRVVPGMDKTIFMRLKPGHSGRNDAKTIRRSQKRLASNPFRV